MRVLILANSGIGIMKFRKELLQNLINENHEVTVSIPDTESVHEIEKLGCQVILTPLQRRGMNPLKDIKLFWRYFKIEKKLNPDIVFTYTIKPNIYGGIISRINKIPYAPNITGLGTTFSEDSNKYLKFLLKMLYRIALKNAIIIFFQNNENLQIFQDLNITKSPSKLLPGSGVNTEEFKYRTYPKKKGTTIVYFGRIMKEKGINELLEASKIIDSNYPDVYFELIGFSEDNNLLEKVQEFQRKGYVKYFGFQSEVSSFIEKANVVIQPSYSEGMSNVLLEASSSGRPVMASNIPGCEEIVDNNTGILFEPKDVNSVVTAIEKFINLPHDDRIRMGVEGREKMKKEFSRKRVVDEYMRIINSIAKD